MNATVHKLTYTVEETGKAIGISRAKAYELVNSDNFPKVRIGKRILIPIEALNRWIEENSVNT